MKKLEFVTAKHDPSAYKDLSGKVNDDLKSAENFQVKEEMSIKLRNWKTYKLLDTTLYNTVWGQFNAVMKAHLCDHKDFVATKKEGHIVGMIKMINQVCMSGEFGNTQDLIH